MFKGFCLNTCSLFFLRGRVNEPVYLAIARRTIAISMFIRYKFWITPPPHTHTVHHAYMQSHMKHAHAHCYMDHLTNTQCHITHQTSVTQNISQTHNVTSHIKPVSHRTFYYTCAYKHTHHVAWNTHTHTHSHVEQNTHTHILSHKTTPTVSCRTARTQTLTQCHVEQHAQTHNTKI